MIRPFDLRDMALIRRLLDRGTALYTEAALTGQTRPMRGALLSYMSVGLLGWGTPTFVLYERTAGRRVTGFAQMRHLLGAEQARLTYLAPAADADSLEGMALLGLLDALVIAAGERGAQSLVAEVAEDGPELLLLRRAGFAVYARQDVWRLTVPLDSFSPPPTNDGSIRLRPRHSADGWGISVLYANTAPRLLQMAEPLPAWRPSPYRRGYVLEHKREILAYIEIREGKLGVWVKALLHPEAEGQADAVIAGTVALIHRRPDKPVYWNVRRYQDWLRGALTDHHFEPWLSQAVMVKHTVARVGEHEPLLAHGLEKRAEISIPVAHSHYHLGL